MDYQLKKDIYTYFCGITNPTEEESGILRKVTDSLEYFDMPGIYRGDLKGHGFDISAVTGEVMQGVTDRLDRTWRENILYIDLPIIAEIMNIPLVPASECPNCKRNKRIYNSDSTRFECLHCGFEAEVELTDLYVLVQYPEDAGYFEENNIGYPSYKSEDNGARYVPQDHYIKFFVKEPDAAQLHKPVYWPEIQELQEDPEFETYAQLINDEKGLEAFGGSACWIPSSHL